MIDLNLLNVGEDSKWKSEPKLDLEKAKIYKDDDEWVVCIGANFTTVDKAQLIQLIKKYKEIFTWTLADMPGIDTSMACHKLSINPAIILV